MNFLLFGSIAYLLGSIPSAVWIGKAWYNIDVREHGSKNAGATNTFRVLGKKAGKIVLFLDVFKGLLAVSLPVIFLEWKIIDFGIVYPSTVIYLQITSAIVTVLGHVFPVFAQFKGGKGVATSLGVIIGIHPEAAGVCFLIFSIVFIVSNYVSLGAICAAISFPLALVYIFGVTNIGLILFSIILGGSVIMAHKKNILRLLKGEESKMRFFKK
jgi:glycerol-3-phosphate acyltransferase PlsY